MMGDRARMDAYVGALERVVKPGSVVVDVGAGTGIFSLHACRLGAGRVYAIDPNPAISLLPELARRNGFGDRVQVFAKPSGEVELPERADVIVSDLRGSSPLFAQHLSVLHDARLRFLREGGVMLPAQDTMMMCLISAPELYDLAVGPLQRSGFDMQPSIDEVVNEVLTDGPYPMPAEQCASPAVEWSTLVYGAQRDARVSGDCVLRCDRDALVHGVALWFRAQIWEELGYENAPGTTTVYRRCLLPWPTPLALKRGMNVRVRVDALPTLDDYGFAWSTETADGTRFKQSNFLGVQAPISGGPYRSGVSLFTKSSAMP